MKKIKYILVLFLFSCLSFASLNLQAYNNFQTSDQESTSQEKTKEKPKKKKELNSPVREEIQRYLGYETLPIRYLSLPYDLTVNSNVPGKHVEIGFLFLMFIPIILLLGFIKKPSLIMLTIFASLFLLMISTSTSSIIGVDRVVINSNVEELNMFIETTNFGDAPASVICAHIYKMMLPVFQPLDRFLNTVSGDKDHFTYPLLMILFVLLFYLIHERIKTQDRQTKTMLNVLYFFGFLWMLLASGIIWYGFLMLPLGLLVIFASFSKLKYSKDLLNRFAFNIFVGCVGVWILISYINRVSNLRPGVLDAQASKYLFDPGIAKYQTGVISAGDVIETYFPKINIAFDQINKDDESLVYRIGTMFPFFIRKSDKRIFQDNQLGFFQNLHNQYSNKIELAQVLKASNFKYLLVDLQTPSIDKTPEQSIVRKYNLLLNFLHQNPRLKLLATDRIIKGAPNSEGKPEQVYDVFGEMIYYGNYAIYQLL